MLIGGTMSRNSSPCAGGTMSRNSSPCAGGTMSRNSSPCAGGTMSRKSSPCAGGTMSHRAVLWTAAEGDSAMEAGHAPLLHPGPLERPAPALQTPKVIIIKTKKMKYNAIWHNKAWTYFNNISQLLGLFFTSLLNISLFSIIRKFYDCKKISAPT